MSIISKGGEYILISNDGVQDQLLTASEYLKNKINYLKTQPINNNILPFLSEIEKTHSVFVNSSYKPHIPVAMEYNKKIPGGNVGFGSVVTFNLPLFGDFINDTVLYIKLSGLKVLDPRDRVRYVSFLGHKLLEHVILAANNGTITIDEYTSEEYNSFYEFEVPPEKKIGWLRNIGQEIPNIGYITSDPSFDMEREYRYIGNGNQTLKYAHDEVELFIPLLFWFKDAKFSLPRRKLPLNSLDIKIRLAELTSIVSFADYGGGGKYQPPSISTCELYINNIFIPSDIYSLYNNRFVFNMARLHLNRNIVINSVQPGIENTIKLDTLKWPIEQLYFRFRLHENYLSGQNWHKNTKMLLRNKRVPVIAKNPSTSIQSIVVSASLPNKAVLTNSLNINNDFYNNYDFIITGGRGYDSNNILNNRYIITGYNGSTKEITVEPNWINLPNNTTTFELVSQQLAMNVITYYEEKPLVSKIGFSSNGIIISPTINEKFFNSYRPYRFGEKLNTPEDRGMYLMNFNLYPNELNPSGTFNNSRSLPLDIKFVPTNYLTPNLSSLIITAKAINFILFDNNQMLLKFMT